MAENLNGDGLNGNGNGFNEAEKFYKRDIKPELEQSLMKIERYFGREGKDVFDFDIDGKRIEWIKEDVNVTDDMGKVVFTQKDVERPIFWSALAIKVVANKYFWGDQLKGERENSIRQLVGRVSKFIGRQALKQGYFDENQSNILRDEFAAICLNQLCSFNSPVWFNVGIQEYNPNAGGVSAYVWDNFAKKAVKSEKKSDRPQCSACFIQSVEDNMESIMAVQAAEANLFKAGSGTGTNRSNLRSSRERLTGGGRASGPVSFMRGYDVYAGVIKSGGKTRRAAKMEILNVEHPDIMDFINAKQNEEKKAWALIEQGYGGGMNGEAYSSVLFQNCNMSVRAPDEFMLAVKNNSEWKTKFVKNGETCETYKAKEIMNKIAEGTWTCGDPGIQCDTIINKYHTCKNSGRINASNPCSEFIFLDDSACNLASINLMRLRTANGGFDIEKFKKVIRTFIIGMDLIVDWGSYPTEKIAENSHFFRPLGLGYANLGALLMSLGLPYDSEEGRAVAAAISAVMCGEAYKTSAELAKLIGPFHEFAKNRESMLNVIKMQREHVKEIDVEKIPADLRDLVNVAWDCWSEALELGKLYGFRNAQTTVLAPTGTIAFILDCDTTGIEPDIALVKYKVLSGGGMLKIINRSVSLALQRLNYGTDEIKEIIDYIDKNDTIEGAPYLKAGHLAVFDCAFKPAKGTRSIHYVGHIDMLSAVQPFISGAISKTVNMPENCTVEDIAKAYIYAWEKKLKAVAIYRENSKRSQPLNTQKTEGEIVKKKEKVTTRERVPMPQTRKALTHKFDIAGHKGYLTVGLYDGGMPGEIFVVIHKEGSTIKGLMDAWARSVSLNLQYGAPVNDLFKKFRHQKFEPSGFIKNEEGGALDENLTQIKSASSIVDYVAQFMLNNFGEGSSGIKIEIGELQHIEEEQAELADFGNEGVTCPICGGPAKRIGNCAIVCTSCKQTTRSGCGE